MNSARWLMLIVLITVAGCGSSGVGVGLPNGATPTPGAPTVDQRQASLEAVRAKFEELYNPSDPIGVNRALEAWLRTRPEFEAVGVHEASSSVWARFSDGRLLVVPNNLHPQSAAPTSPSTSFTSRAGTPPRSRASGDQLPTDGQARVLAVLDGVFNWGGGGTADLARWFTANGYKTVISDPGEASVAKLRTVSGDGFFYFFSHAGFGITRDLLDVPCVVTATLATDASDKDPATSLDLDDYSLAYAVATIGEYVPGTQKLKVVKSYCFTHKFVTKYMNFGEHSIAFFAGCFTTAPYNARFIQALHDKNLSVYLGYSSATDAPTQYYASRYFVDRLLGANTFRDLRCPACKPEDPPQRPFDWESVLKDMESKGLTLTHSPPYPPGKLEAKVKTGSQASNLTPSILFLAVNEGTEELTIIGTFGEPEPPTPDRQVWLLRYAAADLVLDIKDWKKDQIVTRLPPDVLSGDVIVISRGRKSNPRRLMGWRGKMTYTLDDAGSLQETVEIDLIIRRDASLLRGKDEVGKEPRVQFLNYSIARKDARANSSGAGSWTRQSSENCTTTVTWDGGKSVLPSSYYYGGPTPLVGSFDTNVVDVNARTPMMVMALEVLIPEAYTQVTTVTCPGGTNRYEDRRSINHLPQELFVTDPVSGPHTLRLDLDPALNILPGERVAMVDSRFAGDGAPKATAILRWGMINANLPYDPTLPVRKP